MNLNLVSSEHSKQVFLQTQAEQRDQQGNVVRHIKIEKPIEVIFEGVDLNTYFHMDDKDIPENDLVTYLDEIPENFAYLFVGHWLGGALGEDRKNVGMTIKVFLETFKNKKNAPCLILKTSSAGGSILDKNSILNKINEIRKTVKGTLPNIYLIHGDLEEKEINYLYNHPKIKAMVNLTKGEGFGRPLLEFSMVKKPIICSGWSGQIDFLNPEFTNLIGGNLTQVHPSSVVPNIIVAESSWYTADYVQAGQLLVDIHANYKKYIDKANRQSFYSKTNFSFEKMTEKLGEYYKQYVKEQPKLILPQLPKLKKI
jgi:glycosyltransferase involved in cell wall biosynthesis